ncbi:MAG: arsenate reductase ArsC [Nitrospirota bacterium]
MNKEKILFVCVHNSARSQMAEAFCNQLCGDLFEAESAGLQPGNLNPLVIEAMHEIGFDLSGKATRSVFEAVKAGRLFSYVITVCDETAAEKCPVFPGITRRLHWGFPDPSVLTGTHAEKMQEVRKIRDSIRQRIEAWCAEMRAERL